MLVTVAVVAVVATVAILIAERELGRRIYPNISVRGVPIGGLTPDEARLAIERAYGQFLYSPVELQYGGQTWRPTPDDLGVRLMIDEALAQAFALGRSDTRVANIRRAAAVWQQGYDLPLRLEVDQVAMQHYLLGVAAQVEAPPRDAGLGLVGPDIVVGPEVWGTQALIDETIADITAALQRLERQPIALRTRSLEPRLRDAAVAPVADELRHLLGAPVTLTANTGACARGCQWELTPAQIAAWLTVRRVTAADGMPAYIVSLDPAGIRGALLPIAAAVREEGTLPQVAWNGGDLRITEPGEPGRGLDAEQALAEVSAALYSDRRAISLPMTPIPPPVTASNLAALGISEQVGLGVSSFARSEQYRITNIRAGARRMSGVLIPPGASFSFNTQLGAVNAANGFVEGLAIIDNRTQKEWGGGLCQVSTTVFRSAFFAGLPIDERHEHAFRIGWYEELGEPPGLDAAIFTPYNDMRFTNDTGSWLLMESYVDLERQRLSVALYGAPTGRQVAYDHRVIERTPAPTRPIYVNDPAKPSGYFKKSDTARGGIKVELYRTVTAAGRTIARDTFPTEFRPWPNIYVRGTGR
ncbi:MAG: vanomycin resistance protein VanB [Chloroflexales bacterium]|nr:vanomycin resistance protein VanB [Chloroflexales bacterium]